MSLVSLQALRDKGLSIVKFMDQLLASNPSTSAAYFRPHFMHDCRCLEAPCSVSSAYSPSEDPPRLGHWLVSSEGPEFEGKLIMNTKAVGMFYVHYLSMIEKTYYGSREGKWSAKPYIVDMTLEGALLHFKVPAVRSGSVYGASLRYTRKAVGSGGDSSGGDNGSSNDDDPTYVHAIDPVKEDNTLWQDAAVNAQKRIEPLEVCAEFRALTAPSLETHSTGAFSSISGSGGSRKRVAYDYIISTDVHRFLVEPRLNELRQAYQQHRVDASS
jgi:hypothetical protein